MERKKKMGIVALVLASIAFSVPFWFHNTPTKPPPIPPPTGGGGGTSPPTMPLSNSTVTPSNPSVQWQGWHGICHGEGRHLGVLKKAQALGFNLTLVQC